MGLKGKLIGVFFGRNVNAFLGIVIGILFIFFSTVCFGELKLSNQFKWGL